MNDVYLIADPHFGDERILKYENRPFSSVREMDETMIAKWNETVDDTDTVYVLGDFGGEGREAELLAQLKGRKLLVKGNHDTKTNAQYRSFGFAEVYDCPIIVDGFWIFSHDSLYVNTNMPYANIFGHVHNSPIVKDYSKQHYCVSVERIGYQPVALTTVKQRIMSA